MNAAIYTPDDCACLRTPFASLLRERELGMDGHFGEASLWLCTECGRRWLHYFYELEAFTGSGRWFLGELPQGAAAALAAEQAKAALEELGWYFCGGSYFGGERHRASGPLPVP